MTSENIDYYSIGEKERLYATTIEDAIVDFLDGLSEDEYPKVVSVKKHKKLIVSNEFLDDSLDDVLDRLDDEFGDPDGSYTEASDKTKRAFEAFKKVILSEYEVYRCKEVGSPISVNVQDYIKTDPCFQNLNKIKNK